MKQQNNKKPDNHGQSCFSKTAPEGQPWTKYSSQFDFVHGFFWTKLWTKLRNAMDKVHGQSHGQSQGQREGTTITNKDRKTNGEGANAENEPAEQLIMFSISGSDMGRGRVSGMDKDGQCHGQSKSVCEKNQVPRNRPRTFCYSTCIVV